MKELKLNFPKSLRTNGFSIPFMQGMLNRIAFGSIRYKKINDCPVDVRDCKLRLLKCLKKYEETHNTEWLIDVANYAMLEFIKPSFSDAFFKPEDQDPTPSITAYFRAKGDFD